MLLRDPSELPNTSLQLGALSRSRPKYWFAPVTSAAFKLPATPVNGPTRICCCCYLAAIGAPLHSSPLYKKGGNLIRQKRTLRSTGKYTWPRHNIFTLHSHALSVLKRHLMQKRQHLLYSIQLVHQTPVLQLFYKLICNSNIGPFFSFVKWYTYIMHLVSTVSHHLTVFYPGTLTVHNLLNHTPLPIWPQCHYHTTAISKSVLYCFHETSSIKVSLMYGFDSRLIQSGSSNCFVECFRLDLIRL